MKDVLEGLQDAIEGNSTINAYNDVVTFEQLPDTGVPVAGEFRSHCVNLWPVGEPEEEERIGKYVDIRFDVEITAFCKKGAVDAHSVLLLGRTSPAYVGISEFIADLKSLLRFNQLAGILNKAPGDNIREVEYIRVPDTQIAKGRFIFTGYKRQDLTSTEGFMEYFYKEFVVTGTVSSPQQVDYSSLGASSGGKIPPITFTNPSIMVLNVRQDRNVIITEIATTYFKVAASDAGIGGTAKMDFLLREVSR